MLVRDRMSRMPITTNPSATVPDAMQVMRGSKVRQLPVVDEKGNLVGIVALDDLLVLLLQEALQMLGPQAENEGPRGRAVGAIILTPPRVGSSPAQRCRNQLHQSHQGYNEHTES